jgi:hypothetical protein
MRSYNMGKKVLVIPYEDCEVGITKVDTGVFHQILGYLQGSGIKIEKEDLSDSR